MVDENPSISASHKMPRRHIKRIVVHGLFGRLSYQIDVPPDPVSPHNMAILFGDNGCGKTTLLKLVYRLLSSQPAAGHRTYVGTIPFLVLRVTFQDGLVVEANRSDLGIRDYVVIVRDRYDEVVYHMNFEEGKRGVATHIAEAYCAHLRNLRLSIFMLGEDRLVALKESRRGRQAVPGTDSNKFVYSPNLDDIITPAEAAIQNASHWAQRAVIQSLNEGQVTTERIYRDVVTRLLELHSHSDQWGNQSAEAFRTSLREIQSRLKNVSASGFMPSANAIETVSLALDASDNQLTRIQSVVGPFIDSLSARLDALSQTEDVISTFTTTLSDFFVDKHVHFDRREGFLINLDDSNDLLSAQSLSSGEQQLLVLLCTVLSLRDRGGVIIIDEPELSLNAQWQRKVVDAIVRCAKDASVQFLFATHSTAILTQHSLNAIEMRIGYGRRLFRKMTDGNASLFSQ